MWLIQRVAERTVQHQTVNHQGETHATGWMLMKSEHCDSELKLAVELQLGSTWVFP